MSSSAPLPRVALPRVVFAGTPEFAAVALDALLDAGIHVPLVLTQPDRPAGRGMQLQPSAVKRLAVERGIEVFQPVSLKKDASAVEKLRATPHDVMVVAAYGLILPLSVLQIPPRGCINIHASLLPRWRGAAPIHRAIQAGDEETGVCIMGMEEGLDTGPVFRKRATKILSTDTTATLHDKLALIGAELIVEALPLIANGSLTGWPQGTLGMTYAPKIERAEAALDLNRTAKELWQQMRAFDPFPGSALSWKGAPIKVFDAEVLEEGQLVRVFEALGGSKSVGRVLHTSEYGITVRCGDGALLFKSLQKPGSKRLPAREFLQGTRLQAGDHFDVAPASAAP